MSLRLLNPSYSIPYLPPSFTPPILPKQPGFILPTKLRPHLAYPFPVSPCLQTVSTLFSLSSLTFILSFQMAFFS